LTPSAYCAPSPSTGRCSTLCERFDAGILSLIALRREQRLNLCLEIEANLHYLEHRAGHILDVFEVCKDQKR
jgi:hypothetical protein